MKTPQNLCDLCPHPKKYAYNKVELKYSWQPPLQDIRWIIRSFDVCNEHYEQMKKMIDSFGIQE